MASGRGRFWVAVLTVLSLPAFLASQGVCSSFGHSHHGLPCDCNCPCHPGNLPFLQPAGQLGFGPPVPCDWLAPAEPWFDQHDPLVVLDLARAPPA